MAKKGSAAGWRLSSRAKVQRWRNRLQRIISGPHDGAVSVCIEWSLAAKTVASLFSNPSHWQVPAGRTLTDTVLIQGPASVHPPGHASRRNVAGSVHEVAFHGEIVAVRSQVRIVKARER